MSLINQVLLDLDRRHAPAGHLHPQTRSVLTRPVPRLSPRRLAAVLAAATGIGLATLVTLAWSPTRVAVAPRALGDPAAGPIVAPAPMHATDPAAGAIGLGLDPVGAGATVPMVPLPPISLQEPVAAATALADAPRADAPIETALSAAGPAVAVRIPSIPPTPGGTATAGAAEAAVDAPPAAGYRPGPGPGVAPTSTPTPVAGLERPAPPSVAVLPVAAPAPEARVEKRDQPLTAHERAEADYQRALGLHQDGQGKAAQAGFAAALKEDPAHAGARQALAVALIGEGRLDAAQSLLVEGLQLNAQEAALASVLARIKAEQQDLPGAIAVLAAALPANAAIAGRDAPDARALLATLQQRSGRHAEAIENYGRALRQMPNNGAWWIGLALSLTAEGRSDDARDALERARATRSLGPELDQYVGQRLRALAR